MFLLTLQGFLDALVDFRQPLIAPKVGFNERWSVSVIEGGHVCNPNLAVNCLVRFRYPTRLEYFEFDLIHPGCGVGSSDPIMNANEAVCPKVKEFVAEVVARLQRLEESKAVF